MATPSAPATLPRVGSDGVSRPDSICDTMLGVSPAFSASCRCCSPRSAAERLDALAQAGHAALPAGAGASPASCRSARATYTRVIFLR